MTPEQQDAFDYWLTTPSDEFYKEEYQEEPDDYFE